MHPAFSVNFQLCINFFPVKIGPQVSYKIVQNQLNKVYILIQSRFQMTTSNKAKNKNQS